MLYTTLLLIVFFFADVVTFGLFAWDKHLAIYKKFRIPEWLLLFCSAIGGAFGALCAMLLFRHKTQRAKFYFCIPIFFIIHLVIYIVIGIFG